MEYPKLKEEKYKKRKFDSIAFGAVLGIILPLITFTIYYLVLHSYMPIVDFIAYLKGGEIFVATLSLCVIPNLLLFYIFIWTNRDKSSRGVILATLLYAFWVAYNKMFK
jgi:hypothetical protein